MAYTAIVHQPANPDGARIVVSPLLDQSGFQYFNQNIGSAIASHASQLVFPKGAYSIAPEGAANYHILISGGEDLTIDGQGSTLLFTGVVGGDAPGLIAGFKMRGNNRVVLKNFIIDYDVRIASEGTIRSDSAHCNGVTHQYVLIDTATYPMTDVRIQQAKIFNDSTVDLWGIRANEFYTYTAPVNLQDGNAFYPCNGSFDHIFPTLGNKITVRHFAYDGNAIEVNGPNSQDVTLQDLTIYRSPAIGIVFGNSFVRGAAIENVRVVKDPADPTQLVTLAADGLHFDNVSGDIVVENSEIGFQGDDGLNIVTSMPSDTSISSNQVAVASTAEGSFGLDNASVGDMFSFYGADFSYLGSATLESLGQGATIVATFDTLAGVTNGARLLDQAQATARVYIVGNNFHDNRGRGTISRSRGLRVENNVYANNSGPAILLGTDGLHFMEGAFAQDVTIAGNTVTAANQTQVSPGTTTMEFGALSAGVGCPIASGCADNLSPHPLIRNILVQNNTISASAGIGVLLSNVAGASVSGNTVLDAPSTVLQSAFGANPGVAGSIHSTRSTGIGIGSNTLSRPATDD